MNDLERIEKEMDNLGLAYASLDETEDGIVATFGRWLVIGENEDTGLYEGDRGVLSAQVVGAEKYGNVRVCWTFTPDDLDPFTGPEVVPFDDVEPI